MTMLANDRLIRALLRQSVDQTPVWIMRQAGRYLPEYRALRAKISNFLALCKTPELACEATLQPIRRFPLDAAILFSDILTIPHAMGLDLHFETGEGPRFSSPTRDKHAIDALKRIDPSEDLHYVLETIRLVKQELNQKIPLIGFAGSPWTLACYMIEGGSSSNFSKIKSMMYQSPDLLHRLLNHLTWAVSDFLKAQIAAGVDAVMIFDSWGGILPPAYYQTFSLPSLQTIAKNLANSTHPEKPIPLILYSKGAHFALSDLANTGCHAVGLDWTMDLHQARSSIGDRVALQGNLDPGVLYADTAVIQTEVAALLAAYGSGNGHVFNLGHGIWPDVPFENVAFLIDTVHELSRAYH